MKLKSLFLLISILMMDQVAFGRLPKNSYITRPTPNKESFINLLRTDKVVMDRYMRHYAMSREEVLNYMGGIKLSTITDTGLYTVYNVPASTGELRSRLLKMRKGDKIWVDSFGQPLMVQVCGNPMNRGPKSVVTLAQTEEPAIAGEEAPSRLADEELAYEPIASVIAPDAYEPAIPTIQDSTINAVDVPQGVVQAGSSNRSGGLLGVLAAVPLAFIKTGGNKQPVPEPASIAGLVIGAAVLIRRKK